MKLNKKNKFIISSLWLVVIIVSGVWNIYQSQKAQREVNLETARSYFSLIVTIREWNARLGGVYVPVTDEIQPNPHLDIPDRDLHIPNGDTLTKINPAYMTRLIAELAQKNDNINLHITSLKPIRPENAPLPWETVALNAFEIGNQAEFYSYDKGTGEYFYMAPLVTQASCLVCHEKQGYQVGDIRGGISITFDTNPTQFWPIITSHILIAIVGVSLILIFTTQLGKVFDQLEKQSSLDGLTQINNRRYFNTYFNREFLRSRRIQVPLSIILCDVDYFKPYNDHYGHQAGDEVLKKIASALVDTLKRPGDIAARYGGEEFAIVLPDTTHEGAYVIAEMLRAAIESLKIPYQHNQTSKHITISLGFWTFNGGEQTQEDVLEKADKALYLAKKKGRNMACSFNDV